MWLQLVIQIIIVKGSLEAQGSIHMSQKHKIEITPWKKIKENKKAGAQKSQQSAPKCLHPLTFWPSTLEEAEGRSDVTLSTLSPWKCHFFTGRQRRGRRSTAAWLDVPVGFFISEGFAGAALESDGFLLGFFCVCFFTPSQPLTASFISSSFPSFHSLPFWLDRPVLDLRSTDWSELYMFVTCNEPFSWSAMNLCLQPWFWKKILRLDRRGGGKWSEGRRTADFCFCPGLAVLELLTSFRLFFPLRPKPELTGMLLCAFLNAPNVYDFLCKEPGLENKNRRVLKEEGSGRWLKWGPEGHRWEMGGRMHVGGECGEMKVTHGSCYYGCYAFHVWLSCVTMINTKFNVTAAR